MNILEQAERFLSKQRDVFCGVPVEYRRAYAEPITLTATRGSTLFRTENASGITTRMRSVDFIVERAAGFQPEIGDEIICDGERYEVGAPGGEPCWRFSGNNGIDIRIHTHYLGSVENE